MNESEEASTAVEQFEGGSSDDEWENQNDNAGGSTDATDATDATNNASGA